MSNPNPLKGQGQPWPDENRWIEPERADVWSAPSGAKSSGKLPAHHLVPWHVFAARLAARYELGEQKYPSADGVPNWTKGLQDRTFLLDRANHMLEHAHKAVEALHRGASSDDDDLAAVMWGAICLMAAQR